MKIKSLALTNFRLLDKVCLNIEDDITLIVGKNNTGKTSLFEAIGLFTNNDDNSKLSFEDFSLSSHKQFQESLAAYEKILITSGEDEKDLLKMKLSDDMPKMQLSIEFQYDKTVDNSLIHLSEFLTDLDESRNDAVVLLSFESNNTLKLFKDFNDRNDKKMSLILFLKENLKNYYQLNCYAIDKKSHYKRPIDNIGFKNKIKKIVSFENIRALRILDDKKGDRNNTLALGFSNYYKQRDKENETVKALEVTLQGVSGELKGKYKKVLKDVLDDLDNFGMKMPYAIPKIDINSEFDSEMVIKNNIKYYYEHEGMNLPESYNGLGYSNLIYMILELISFIEKFNNSKDEKISEILMVLIEEPEAHMHPQMQQVFIREIKNKIKAAKIPIQLIITSHSSHIIAEAGIDLEKGLERIRYFRKVANSVEVEDFNFFKHKEDDKENKETIRFLKQYMNLHKCDLFFADKVIMVEGITEKLLLPQMIEKVAPDLKHEYISLLEVGGAYTRKFKELLSFIKVKTLIITDIDSCNSDDKKDCPVNGGNNGEITSNDTLINWLPGKEKIIELINCTESEKIYNNNIRVAYQIAEKPDKYVARSLEESIINKNIALIKSVKMVDGKEKKVKNAFSLFKTKPDDDISTQTPYDLAPTSKAKTNFTFDLMNFDEATYGKWEVPFYIQEGLEWLAKSN